MSDIVKVNDSTDTSAPDPNLVGIGGWLILPAIGFILGPITGVILLVVAVGYLPDVANAEYGGVFMLEMLVSAGFLAFLIYTATRFFAKKKNAPLVIIYYLCLSVAASALVLVVELGAGAEEFAVETGRQLVREVISAIIWVSYFRKSERVKATFIN